MGSSSTPIYIYIYIYIQQSIVLAYILPKFTDDFRMLFKHVLYSDPGTNARAKEEQTYVFIDFWRNVKLVRHLWHTF